MKQLYISMLSGLLLCFLTVFKFGCGTPGVPSDQLSGDSISEIRGTIVGSTGSQGGMFGNNLVLVERDTGISRFSPIDSAGIYSFTNVKAGAAHTLILLSPTYKVRSVLSISKIVPDTIRQFFIPNSTFFPRLIHDDATMRFETEDTLSITSDSAADANSNGIPTGMDTEEGGGISLVGRDFNTALALVRGNGPDTDGDNLANEIDFDLDGDGIINWFDIDMDNLAPIDAFDANADDDLYNDAVDDPTLKNRYDEGVEYFAVTVERGPAFSGSGTETLLSFHTKVRDPVKDVFVEAPNSLLGSSCYRIELETTSTPTTDEEGGDAATETATEAEPEISCVKYNKKLNDDGKSNDGEANDLKYGQTFVLGPGATPLGNQVVFAKLDYGGNVFKYFPYIFPDVTLGTFTVQYDANDFRFRKSSGTAPFGSGFSDYEWQVRIVDATGKQEWESRTLKAAETEIRIDDAEVQGLITAAAAETPPRTLQAVGYAFSLQKIPGAPAYVVRSTPEPIN